MSATRNGAAHADLSSEIHHAAGGAGSEAEPTQTQVRLNLEHPTTLPAFFPTYSRLAIIDRALQSEPTRFTPIPSTAPDAHEASQQTILLAGANGIREALLNQVETYMLLLLEKIGIDAPLSHKADPEPLEFSPTELFQFYQSYEHQIRHTLLKDTSLDKKTRLSLVTSLPELEAGYLKLRSPITQEELADLQNLCAPTATSRGATASSSKTTTSPTLSYLTGIRDALIEYGTRSMMFAAFRSSDLKQARTLREIIIQKVATLLSTAEAHFKSAPEALQSPKYLRLILEYLQFEYDQIDYAYPKAGRSEAIQTLTHEWQLKVADFEYKSPSYQPFHPATVPFNFKFELDDRPKALGEKTLFQSYSRDWILQQAWEQTQISPSKGRDILFWADAIRIHYRYQVLMDIAVILKDRTAQYELSSHYTTAIHKILTKSDETVSEIPISVQRLIGIYFQTLPSICHAYPHAIVLGQNFYKLQKEFKIPEITEFLALTKKAIGTSVAPLTYPEKLTYSQLWLKDMPTALATWNVFLAHFKRQLETRLAQLIAKPTQDTRTWHALSDLHATLSHSVSISDRLSLCHLSEYCEAKLIQIQNANTADPLSSAVLNALQTTTEFLSPFNFLQIVLHHLRTAFDLSLPDPLDKSKKNHNAAVKQAITQLEVLQTNWRTQSPVRTYQDSSFAFLPTSPHRYACGSLIDHPEIITFDAVINILCELAYQHSPVVSSEKLISADFPKKLIADLFHEERGVTAYLPNSIRETTRNAMRNSLLGTEKPQQLQQTEEAAAAAASSSATVRQRAPSTLFSHDGSDGDDVYGTRGRTETRGSDLE